MNKLLFLVLYTTILFFLQSCRSSYTLFESKESYTTSDGGLFTREHLYKTPDQHVFGDDYQALLTWIIMERLLKYDTITMAPEMNDCGKFDDIVFQYKEEGKIYTSFVQVKYNANHLRDFEEKILELFLSYCNILDDTSSRNDLLKNRGKDTYILYTNAGMPCIQNWKIKEKDLTIDDDHNPIMELDTTSKTQYYEIEPTKNVINFIFSQCNKKYNKEKIKEFLNTLVLAFNQPDLEKLQEIFINKITTNEGQYPTELNSILKNILFKHDEKTAKLKKKDIQYFKCIEFSTSIRR